MLTKVVTSLVMLSCFSISSCVKGIQVSLHNVRAANCTVGSVLSQVLPLCVAADLPNGLCSFVSAFHAL